MRLTPILLPLLAPLLAIVAGCQVETSNKSAATNKHASSASHSVPLAQAAPSPQVPAAEASAQAAPVPQSPAAQAANDPLPPKIARINQAAMGAGPLAPSAPASPGGKGDRSAGGPPNPFIIRAEVLLARARFSPGVVDGQFGTNFKHAVAAYQTAHDLPVSGKIDAQTWQALSTGAAQPVASEYTITAADVAGPFAADVGEDFVKLAALPNGPQFNTPLEALAEKFHMSQALMKALNPGVDPGAAGVKIIVVNDAPPDFAKGDVARVDVSKADAAARAYDKDDKLIAFYPATVGSTERPSPSGVHKVVGVAWNPDYTYDPKKLAWGPRAAGKLLIKPGPNNPVGQVWIDLNAPSYGVHGTPDPDKIGKTASHGCVRLTNWDATALAHGVKPGVVVRFLGERGGAKS
jgi:lipoprotein-anchoring transpeptidase ErfK/SrfK